MRSRWRGRLASGATALLHVLLSFCIFCAASPISATDVAGEGGCCANECVSTIAPPSAAIAPEKRTHERPLATAILLAVDRDAVDGAAFETRDVRASRLFAPLTTIQLRI